jgi:hypothetical protein
MTTGIEEILQQQDEGEETPPETTETETKEEKVEPVVEGEEVVTEETSEKPVEEIPAIPPDNTELNELRQFIREQRKEIAAMKAKLGRVKENSETDDEGNTTITYTPLENLQRELHNVAISRSQGLSDMVENMELSSKFEDVRSVCTKDHFDDIFELAATTISRNERRDFNEVLVQLELEVWKMPNPYKYMYGVIKGNHPKYKEKEKEKETTKKEEIKPQTTAKKVLEAKEAPGSIAAAGSGENLGTGAWTAAKIDDLEESELHQVPVDIYKKYMMGKLK